MLFSKDEKENKFCPHEHNNPKNSIAWEWML